MNWAFAMISTLVLLAANDAPIKFPRQDLLAQAKSDSAIKPFVFPKSMTTIQSCALNYFCVFHDPELGILSYDENNVGLNPDQINQIFSDQMIAHKILRKVDPARVSPVKQGKFTRKPVARDLLKALGKQHDSDFILVYRVYFHWLQEKALVRMQGLIYLVRQNKVLIVPANDQSVVWKYELKDALSFKKPPLQNPNFEEQIKEIYPRGLQQLAKDTRKVIMSHKFEKRRSNY